MQNFGSESISSRDCTQKIVERLLLLQAIRRCSMPSLASMFRLVLLIWIVAEGAAMFRHFLPLPIISCVGRYERFDSSTITIN